MNNLTIEPLKTEKKFICPECHSETTRLVKEPENGGFRSVCDMCNWYGPLQGVVVLPSGMIDIKDLVLLGV